MLFDFGLRSSLLLVFFTHILVYAGISLRRGLRQQSNSDLCLSGFLALSASFILPWMCGFGGWYDTQPYRDVLFYTPFVNGLLLGPLLYLYVKSCTNFDYRFTRKDVYHFIPGLLYLAWSLVAVVVDKAIVHRYYLLDGRSDPDLASWYTYTWLISLLGYLLLSVRHYRLYLKFIPYELSFADTVTFSWLRNFLVAFALLTLFTLAVRVAGLFVDLDYWDAWYYYLFFAIIVYYIAITGYSAAKVPLYLLRFDPQRLHAYTDPAPAPDEAAPEAGGAPLPPAEPPSADWTARIEAAVIGQKLYENPELTLGDLAKRLSTNTSVLSKQINLNFKMNFNDFINQQRVLGVCRRLEDPKFQNNTLLSVALDAGFNSKSTFNRAFLKFAGKTPKAYFDAVTARVKSQSGTSESDP